MRRAIIIMVALLAGSAQASPRVDVAMLATVSGQPSGVGTAASLRLPVGPLLLGVEADFVTRQRPDLRGTGSMARLAAAAALRIGHETLGKTLSFDAYLQGSIGRQQIAINDDNKIEHDDYAIDLVGAIGVRVAGRLVLCTVGLRKLVPEGAEAGWMIMAGIGFQP